jgi:hypothetical protein
MKALLPQHRSGASQVGGILHLKWVDVNGIVRENQHNYLGCGQRVYRELIRNILSSPERGWPRERLLVET